ncbi:hypothetical protein CDD83_1941 [Cordyceps sp. RAO-2017]|nr:hypothetical protein CDD83_1941 [Cordyceps sp. RAO-2017]
MLRGGPLAAAGLSLSLSLFPPRSRPSRDGPARLPAASLWAPEQQGAAVGAVVVVISGRMHNVGIVLANPIAPATTTGGPDAAMAIGRGRRRRQVVEIGPLARVAHETSMLAGDDMRVGRALPAPVVPGPACGRGVGGGELAVACLPGPEASPWHPLSCFLVPFILSLGRGGEERPEAAGSEAPGGPRHGAGAGRPMRKLAKPSPHLAQRRAEGLPRHDEPNAAVGEARGSLARAVGRRPPRSAGLSGSRAVGVSVAAAPLAGRPARDASFVSAGGGELTCARLPKLLIIDKPAPLDSSASCLPSRGGRVTAARYLGRLPCLRIQRAGPELPDGA